MGTAVNEFHEFVDLRVDDPGPGQRWRAGIVRHQPDNGRRLANQSQCRHPCGKQSVEQAEGFKAMGFNSHLLHGFLGLVLIVLVYGNFSALFSMSDESVVLARYSSL